MPVWISSFFCPIFLIFLMDFFFTTFRSGPHCHLSWFNMSFTELSPVHSPLTPVFPIRVVNLKTLNSKFCVFLFVFYTPLHHHAQTSFLTLHVLPSFLSLLLLLLCLLLSSSVSTEPTCILLKHGWWIIDAAVEVSVAQGQPDVNKWGLWGIANWYSGLPLKHWWDIPVHVCVHVHTLLQLWRLFKKDWYDGCLQLRTDMEELRGHGRSDERKGRRTD